MTWHTEQDSFLSFSSWLNSFYYAVPAVAVAVIMNHFDATKPYLIPALLVYLIAAIAHMIGYGFQAVCVQIKVCTDYAVEQSAAQRQSRFEDSES